MPSRGRQPASTRGRSTSSSTASGRAGAPAAPARAERAESPGWLERAGGWLSDKYDAAADWVSDTAEGVATGTRDLWEVAKSTDVDVDWSERKVTTKTDMDEVMDLLPASARDQLRLQRDVAGANEVELTLDWKNHTVTVRSSELRILGVDTAGLKAGQTSVRDVQIVIKGDGGLPLVGDAKQTAVDVRVGSVVAEGVTAQTGTGPVSADRVELGAMVMSARSEGKDLRRGEDLSSARFYVANAVLDGVAGNGGQLGRVEASALEGGLDNREQTGFVAAGSLGATGVRSADGALGSVGAEGVRVDLAKDAAGQTTHQTSVQHVRVGDAAMADGTTVHTGHATGLRASGGLSALQLAADEVGVGGLSAGRTTIDAATARRLELDVAANDQSWNGRFRSEDLSVRGVTAGGTRIDGASASGLSGAAGSNGALDLAAARAGVNGLSDGNFGVGSASGTGVRFATDGQSVRAGSDALAVSALRSGDVRVGDASLSGLGYEQGAAGQRYVASGASARDLAIGDRTRVGSVRLGAADVRAQGGAVDARLASLSAAELRHEDSAVAAAELSGLRARAADGAVSGEVERLGARGVDARAGGHRVVADALTVERASGRAGADGASGQVGSLVADGLGVDAHRATRLALTDASGSHGASGTRARVGRVEGAGLASGEASLGAVSLDQLALDHRAGGLEASLAAGEVRDLSSPDLRAARASVSGVRGGAGPGGSWLSADAAGVDGLAARGASVEQARLAALRLDQQGTGLSGSAGRLDARGIDAGAVRVGQLGVDGLSAGRDARGTHVGADAASAERIGVRSGDTRVDVASVSGRGLGARTGPGGSSASADELALRDARGSTSLARGRGGAGLTDGLGGAVVPGSLSYQARLGLGAGTLKLGDTADLVRSGGALVRDADVSGRATLRGADHGAVEVEDGTVASARASVRDGRIVPGQARVDFSKELDGPLWVGGRGAYVDDKGRLRADLSGMWDIDLGKRVAPALGMERFSTSVGDLSSAAARSMPSGGPSNGAVTLAEGQRVGDNAVEVKGGHEGLVLSFSRFLTSALRLDTGAGQVSAGAGSVEGGSLRVDEGAQQTGVSGSVGAITLRNVKASQ